MKEQTRDDTPGLVRGLSTLDGALITIGGVVGTAIFLTPADVARNIPHAGLILVAWGAGGLLALAGALTYAELGAMFPRAGGQYQFLKEAYGPLWGFLFGWGSFFVMMSGALAALAVGFGEYLGSFLPIFSASNVLFSVPVGGGHFRVAGHQLAGALAIALLTAINVLGLREGAGLQNAVTVLKVVALLALGGVGLFVPASARLDVTAPLPEAGVLTSFGLAMIAVAWAYDGWYVLVFSAGEVKEPERSLPRALLAGTLMVAFLYLLLNWVYLRALPLAALAESPRAGEAAALALFGPAAARLVSAAVLVSIFGCLAANILCCSRIYQPMAADGLFFRKLAAIHPRRRTPAASLVAQGIWSAVLALSGSYTQLFTYVTFAQLLFFAAVGVALFALRRSRPRAPRPYKTWGYPWVPGIFVVSSLAIAGNTLVERPVESLTGLALLALGLPAYAFWRARSARTAAPAPAEGSRA